MVGIGFLAISSLKSNHLPATNNPKAGGNNGSLIEETGTDDINSESVSHRQGEVQ